MKYRYLIILILAVLGISCFVLYKQFGTRARVLSAYTETEESSSADEAHQKEAVSRFLQEKVRTGEMSPEEAKKIMDTNWLEIFHQMRD